MSQELSFYLELFLTDKKERSLFVSERKLWLYVFQVEAIRSAQFGKLFFTKDKYNFFPREIYNLLKSKRLFYKPYNLFSLQRIKTYNIVKGVLSEIPSNMFNSVVPLDVAIECTLFEFKKRIFFIYNSFFFSSINYKSDFNFSTRFPSSFDIEILNNLFSINVSLDASKISTSFVFEIFLSSPFILTKFRLLGLLHPLKNLPISNPQLLLLQDKEIIRYYGRLSFDIINWYRCSYNLSRIKVAVEILRQGCLLTLSRKHNKRKTWSYFVFTSDLLILKGLFSNQSFFPSKITLAKLKRKFLNSESDMRLLNEKFFLA